jgi:hypothetical protein
VPYSPTAPGPAHHLDRPTEQPPPAPGHPDHISGEHAMSADPIGEQMRRTDDDVLARLAAIDHRLHQISTQLTTMNTLHSQPDEICANLDKLISGRRVDREPRVPTRNHAVSTRWARPLDDRLRWVQCPVDQQLHLLAPDGVATTGIQSPARTLCRRHIPVKGLTLKEQSGSLCVSCLATRTAS